MKAGIPCAALVHLATVVCAKDASGNPYVSLSQRGQELGIHPVGLRRLQIHLAMGIERFLPKYIQPLSRSELPNVTIVVIITAERHFLCDVVYRNFNGQEYPRELLSLHVFDEATEICQPLRAAQGFDSRLRVTLHNTSDPANVVPLKLGAIRTDMVRKVEDPVVVMMDSDDWYHPLYVQVMVASLLHHSAGGGNTRLVSLELHTCADFSLDATVHDIAPCRKDGGYGGHTHVFYKQVVDDTPEHKGCAYQPSRAADEHWLLRCVNATYADPARPHSGWLILQPRSPYLMIKLDWMHNTVRKVWGDGKYDNLEASAEVHTRNVHDLIMLLHDLAVAPPIPKE